MAAIPGTAFQHARTTLAPKNTRPGQNDVHLITNNDKHDKINVSVYQWHSYNHHNIKRFITEKKILKCQKAFKILRWFVLRNNYL